MGNCAGCTGPQRTYRVERLQENSPIKNRLSQGNKYFTPSSSNLKQFSFNEKDKIVQRGSFNDTDFLSNIIGMTQSKSRPNILTNQPQYSNTNQFQNNIFQQVIKTHIKLYPDNPQNLQTTTGKLERSYVYQKQDDLRNSKLQASKRQNSSGTYSNQLLKSVQSESKKYLREFNNQQRNPHRMTESVFNNGSQIRMSSPMPNAGFQNAVSYEPQMPRFDDISQIRAQKMSRNNYDYQNSLPLKRYSKYNRDLTVIEQILQQDHRTPLDIKLQRKKNGQDVVFDTFEGFPQQLQPLQIPNLEQYLSVFKLIVQKN